MHLGAASDTRASSQARSGIRTVEAIGGMGRALLVHGSAPLAVTTNDCVQCGNDCHHTKSVLVLRRCFMSVHAILWSMMPRARATRSLGVVGASVEEAVCSYSLE